MGYGVFKLTERPRGVFLDIMTTLKNAKFFIFLGVYGQRDQNVKKYLDLNNKEFKGLGPIGPVEIRGFEEKEEAKFERRPVRAFLLKKHQPSRAPLKTRSVLKTSYFISDSSEKINFLQILQFQLLSLRIERRKNISK